MKSKLNYIAKGGFILLLLLFGVLVVACTDDMFEESAPTADAVNGPKYEDYIGAWLVTGDVLLDDGFWTTITYQVSVEQKVKGHSYYVRGWAGSSVSFDFPFEMRYNSNGSVSIPTTQELGEYNYENGKAKVCLGMSNSHQQLLPFEYKAGLSGTLVDDKVEFKTARPEFTITYCNVRGDLAFYLIGDEYPLLDPVMTKLPKAPVYYRDKSVIELQKHTKGEGINLYIVGDGYTAEYDFGQNGKFMTDALGCVEAFFAVEPMPTLRDYFTIKVIASHSKERGVSSGYSSLKRNTLFDVKLTNILSSSNVGVSYDKVHDYVYNIVTDKEKRGYNIILVMANQDESAGTAYLNDSENLSNVAVVPITNKQDGYQAIVRHEAVGHAFAMLLDEYVYYGTQIPDSEKKSIQESMSSGFGANLSFESRLNTHWAKYYQIPGYDMVGYYEGAVKYQYGVWRAEEYSCMDNNVPYFSAPSREKIYSRVLERSGIPFDFNEFVEYDKINIDQGRSMTYKSGTRLRDDVIFLKNFSE